MNRTQVFRVLTAVVTALPVLAGGAAQATDSPARGTLVSSTPVAALNPSGVAALLAHAGLDTSRIRYGVRALRIVYQTIDPRGAPTTASGLVALPDPVPDTPLRLVSWEHGTLGFRGDAASVSADSDDRAIAMLFAAAGYAVSAPDYLGLGEGPGAHPYDDHDSAVTASADALHALRALPQSRDHPLDGRVLVSGFSQGGAVAMALGRALQAGADRALSVGALAPIGGPYDMSGTLATALNGGIAYASAYLGYVTVAWNRLHGLYRDPAEVFRPPYDRTAEALFDGTHRSEEILAGVPETLPELFTDSYLERLRHPTGALRAALARGDATCDWKPAVPVRIYHASGDRDVPPANAAFCHRALLARGARATVIDLGGLDHGGSVLAALPLVLDQFATAG